MKLFVACVLAVATVGCATTNPGSGAGIYYRLPRTDVKVTLTVDVTSCAPFKASGSLTMDAVAGVQDDIWQVDGDELSSRVTKRGLTIDIGDNGVISGVNATATDQRSVILGNVLKIAASLVGVRDRAGSAIELHCSTTAQKSIQLVGDLKRKVEEKRSELLASPNPARVQKEIDAFASQLAAAKLLAHREVTTALKLEKNLRRSDAKSGTEGTALTFDLASIHELLSDSDDVVRTAFLITAYYVDASPIRSALGTSGSFDKAGSCSMWIVIPGASEIVVTLDADKSVIRDDQGKAQFVQALPASQLGTNQTLCLSAAFGENRQVGLKFDKFGRRTEMAWTSDATSANVFASLAGAAPDAATVISGLEGRELAAEKSELDKLTTAQSLAKARACQALLDAGASSCPSD